MLTFYENRARKNLNDDEKELLEKAKDRLRNLLGRKKNNRKFYSW